MTVTEIEKAIEDLIERIYCAKYIKKLKVVETFLDNGEHLGYILKMGVNKPEKPFTIAMEGDCKQFLKFVESQLRFTGLDKIDYFEGYSCDCPNNKGENEECCC